MFEKKDLKAVVVEGVDVTWGDVRNLLSRNYHELDSAQMMVILFKPLLQTVRDGAKYDQLYLAAKMYSNGVLANKSLCGLFDSVSKWFTSIKEVLIREGIVEFVRMSDYGDVFRAAPAGCTLRMQKDIPPISRQKADGLLNAVIQNARKINADPSVCYNIERIDVFGSYLSDKQQLGDLDLAFSFSADFKDMSHEEYDAYFEKNKIRSEYQYLRKLLRPNRSVSFIPLESLNEMVEGGYTTSKCVFERDK